MPHRLVTPGHSAAEKLSRKSHGENAYLLASGKSFLKFQAFCQWGPALVSSTFISNDSGKGCLIQTPMKELDLSLTVRYSPLLHGRRKDQRGLSVRGGRESYDRGRTV